MDAEEFNFEAARKPDLSIEKVVKLINPFYNIENEKHLHFLHHGTYNVYEIDDYIFRIPDRSLFNEKGYMLIINEIEKLNFLRNKINVAIPNPKFVSQDRKNPIVGYKKLPGDAIENIWPILNSKQRLNLAKSLGEFLTLFHNPNLTESFKKRFKNELNSSFSLKSVYEKFYNQVEEFVFPLIAIDIKNHLTELFATFFSFFDTKTFDLCLTHSDFDTSNILINKETGGVVGIIDFEDTGLGDPASDLIFINEGKEFQSAILMNYKRNIDDYFKFRIKFYFQKAGLHYIMYGLEHNQPELVDHGKYLLKRRKEIDFEF